MQYCALEKCCNYVDNCVVLFQVLATDMAAHYEHVGNMKSMIESKMATSKEIVLDAYNDRVEVSNSGSVPIGYSVIVALTGLPIGYSVIVALTGLPIGYSVIVALTGLPIGYSVIVALTVLPIDGFNCRV